MNKKVNNAKGVPILLITALIWGVAFTAQSVGAEYLGGFSYTAIRFCLGVLLLCPAVFILERKAHDKAKLRRTVISGICCGLVMFTATVLQQFGIQLSGNSGKAGFITCLYILIVPIFGLFMRKIPPLNVAFAVVLGIVGMYLLTFEGSGGFELGDLLVMLSAFMWAVHIIVIDRFACDIYSLRFSLVQYATVAVISTVCMFVFEEVTFEAVKAAWLPLAYGGFGSVGIAYTLQAIGQRYADPTPASLALSMESVFAALAGALILDERLPIKGYIGCVLIFAAIILAQLPEKYFKITRKANDE